MELIYKLVEVISIHALRGEGDQGAFGLAVKRGISIHALRGEGDLAVATNKGWTVVFQSTPSVGRATMIFIFFYPFFFISIHALRGEGDRAQKKTQWNF